MPGSAGAISDLLGVRGMWCRHCQQDVPAVAQAGDGRVQCARCQRPLSAASPGAKAFAAPVGDVGIRIDPSHGDAESAAVETESVIVEPWTVDDVLREEDERRLKQIGRQIRTHRAAGAPAAERRFRFDSGPAERGPAASNAPPEPPAASRPTLHRAAPAPTADPKPSQASAWLLALVGSLLLGAGIGLLGWSIFGQRPDLWNLGVGASLAGQGLIIVGLVQLLATLWGGSRDATNRLIALHYEVRRLQRTADSIAGATTANPSAFYADLARGSSPQVLLASLKGQVDELAARYGDA
ncbi:MAG: hypothetical protein AAGB00_08905 [Planctomycetota bacterium]